MVEKGQGGWDSSPYISSISMAGTAGSRYHCCSTSVVARCSIAMYSEALPIAVGEHGGPILLHSLPALPCSLAGP